MILARMVALGSPCLVRRMDGDGYPGPSGRGQSLSVHKRGWSHQDQEGMPSRVARGCDRPRATDRQQDGRTVSQSASQSVPARSTRREAWAAASCKGEDVKMGLSLSSRE